MEFNIEDLTIIPNDLIDDATFASPVDKLIMICLFRNEGIKVMHTKKLAEMTCTTVEEVEAGFMRLVEMGLLQTQDLTLQ